MSKENENIAYVVTAVAIGLFGVVASWFGYDQWEKRKKEAEKSRKKIAEIRAQLDKIEPEHEALKARLGEKNEQVRKLASEIKRLKEKLAQFSSDDDCGMVA